MKNFIIIALVLAFTVEHFDRVYLAGYSLYRTIFVRAEKPQYKVGDCISYVLTGSLVDGKTGRIMDKPHARIDDEISVIVDIVDEDYVVKQSYVEKEYNYSHRQSFSHIENSYVHVNCDGKYP